MLPDLIYEFAEFKLRSVSELHEQKFEGEVKAGRHGMYWASTASVRNVGQTKENKGPSDYGSRGSLDSQTAIQRVYLLVIVQWHLSISTLAFNNSFTNNYFMRLS